MVALHLLIKWQPESLKIVSFTVVERFEKVSFRENVPHLNYQFHQQ